MKATCERLEPGSIRTRDRSVIRDFGLIELTFLGFAGGPNICTRARSEESWATCERGLAGAEDATERILPPVDKPQTRNTGPWRGNCLAVTGEHKGKQS